LARASPLTSLAEAVSHGIDDDPSPEHWYRDPMDSGALGSEKPDHVLAVDFAHITRKQAEQRAI
jgi:hypothetical protein